MRITAVLALGGAGLAAAQGGTPGDFDLYVFAQSWQPTFCFGMEASYPGCDAPTPWMKENFTIHGLWPQYAPARNGSDYPATCAGEAFDVAQIDVANGGPGMEAMVAYWPNVKAAPTPAATYDGFWEHEWTKHGTCTGLKQGAYYSTVLSMLWAMPTPDIIRSNVGQSGSADNIRKAYGGASKVSLACTGTGGSVLSAALTCWAVDKASHAPSAAQVACPKSVLAEDNCVAPTITIDAFVKPPKPGTPTPAPVPTPAVNKCVPFVHGPACTADAECLKVPGCVRCAASGFCTTQPK